MAPPDLASGHQWWEMDRRPSGAPTRGNMQDVTCPWGLSKQPRRQLETSAWLIGPALPWLPRLHPQEPGDVSVWDDLQVSAATHSGGPGPGWPGWPVPWCQLSCNLSVSYASLSGFAFHCPASVLLTLVFSKDQVKKKSFERRPICSPHTLTNIAQSHCDPYVCIFGLRTTAFFHGFIRMLQSCSLV